MPSFHWFPGGKWELEGTERAAAKAVNLFENFRAKGLSVVHMGHEFPTSDAPFFLPGSMGARAHSSAQELAGEPVIIKHHIHSFREINLQQILDKLNIESVIICGAMSHMCIDAVTRAANDFGYHCAVAHDACATLALEFSSITVPAKQVHAAFMAALDLAYANVVSTAQLLSALGQPS